MEEKKIFTAVPAVKGNGEKALEGTEMGEALEKLKEAGTSAGTEKEKKKAGTEVREAITIDDQKKRVPIVNLYGEEIGVFYFSPTDTEIVGRYAQMEEKIKEVMKPLSSLKEDSTPEETGKALAKAKKLLYEAVDFLFGGNASEAFFGKAAPFSISGGKFYFETALEKASEYITPLFENEFTRISERAKSYLDEDE